MAIDNRMPILRLVLASASMAVLTGGTVFASPLSVDEKVRNALQLDQHTERGATLHGTA